MQELTTPGKRLKFFCKTFFTSITEFSHGMGFQKPGSLYDYFKDTKKPGGLLLDKFRLLGGNPTWLRYGTGSMFAENEAGEMRKIEYRNKFPNDPAASAAANKIANNPRLSYSHTGEIITSTQADEMVFLHLSTVQFRLHAAVDLPAQALRLYRSLLEDINKRINALEEEE